MLFITAPEIPSSVTNMQYTFYRCSSLTGEVKILTTTLESYNYAFSNASKNTGTNLVVKVKTQEIKEQLESTLSGYEHITFELITE